jgi:acetyltransferase-like isoleucine patch superfamily enzyme
MNWGGLKQRIRHLQRHVSRKVKPIAKRLLLEIRFRMLVAWHSIIGPPRILQFDRRTNARLLRAFGASVSRSNVQIPSPITLHVADKGFHNLSIGANVAFNGNNWLDLTEKITLEDGVSLGPGVIILTHNAFNKNVFLEERLSRLVGKGPVTIGAGTGIKANAIILHSTTIGREAVVAGGSIVSRDVPDHAYVSGIPAKVKKIL